MFIILKKIKNHKTGILECLRAHVFRIARSLQSSEVFATLHKRNVRAKAFCPTNAREQITETKIFMVGRVCRRI